MESFGSHIDEEPKSKDISKEFQEMNTFDFQDFLRSQRNEPALSITINWIDIDTARRLKAFLDDFGSTRGKGQKRTAAIKATEKQKMQELNVFGSGVEWIEVKE